jgi:hypothetical protein
MLCETSASPAANQSPERKSLDRSHTISSLQIPERGSRACGFDSLAENHHLTITRQSKERKI